MSRPTVTEVLAYRTHVDDAMARLIEIEADRWESVEALIELGLNHEQQHQELLLTDIKHVFACNPLDPAYQTQQPVSREEPSPLAWLDYEGGLLEIGHDGRGFAFDNEGPRHRVHIEPFRLASRLVTNGEYLAFIEDGGYARPELWLSDGWAALQARGWTSPLHWWHDGEDWTVMTLSGRHRPNLDEPVCHVSYYEADAFAQWSGHRLPTEAEWETAAPDPQSNDNMLARGYLHPLPAVGGAPERGAPLQMFGDVWEWTRSSYSPYPGFRAAAGAVGEYNGKFMVNQMVLRGGSCVTPPGHIRTTYRNFFPPDARWQFSGIRLAENRA
jgi:ergothioneine biosynthesis protein EgtB